MATIDDVAEKLAAHERIMQDRYEHLEKGIAEIKSAESAEGKDMAGTVNVEASPLGGLLPLMMGGGNWGGGSTAGAVGGGLGAGVLGGILGGALLGNRRGGLLGGDGDGGAGCVTPTQFQAGLNSVTEANNTSTILQTLGDIKASVPLAEGQVQLALQGTQAQLTSAIDSTGDQILQQANSAQIANLQGQASLSRQLSDVIATSLASQSTIKDTVQDGVASVNLGIANLATAQLQNTYALNTAIRDGADRAVAASVDQGEKTRALITQYRDAENQRIISDLTNALNNERADSRVRASEINITNTNTATAQQMQFQTMQQQQFQILANLAANVNNLTSEMQQVKQGSVIFNSGRMVDAGNQSAANTRVSG